MIVDAGSTGLGAGGHDSACALYGPWSGEGMIADVRFTGLVPGVYVVADAGMTEGGPLEGQ